MGCIESMKALLGEEEFLKIQNKVKERILKAKAGGATKEKLQEVNRRLLDADNYKDSLKSNPMMLKCIVFLCDFEEIMIEESYKEEEK